MNLQIETLGFRDNDLEVSHATCGDCELRKDCDVAVGTGAVTYFFLDPEFFFRSIFKKTR